MTLQSAPPLDLGIPAIFVALCGGGALVLLAVVIGLEAIVYRRMLPDAKAVRDSAIANIASTLLGIPFLWFGIGQLSDLADLFWFGFLVVTWALSVAVEAGILRLLERSIDWRKIVAASATANVLSYLLLLVALILAPTILALSTG